MTTTTLCFFFSLSLCSTSFPLLLPFLSLSLPTETKQKQGAKLARRRFSSETAPNVGSAGPSSSSSSTSVPPVALALGAAGALPFLALAPQVEPHVPLLPRFVRDNAAALQVGYGAAIASFLGGIHWGLAASGVVWQRRGGGGGGGGGGRGTSSFAAPSAAAACSRATAARYLWSVVPCLLAWPSTALIGDKGEKGKEGDRRKNEARAAGVAAATLAAAAAADAAFASKGLLPPYLMKLRVPLSFAAVGGLGLRALDAREKR